MGGAIMASLIPSGSASGTGSMTLAAPVTNSNQTATLPDATGTVMVSGNMPAFSAYIGTAQTVTTGVFTKLALNTKTFDTANAFDSTTNYRFTPQVAGYYQFNGAVAGQAAGGMGALYVTIYKNGTNYQYGDFTNTASGASSFGLTTSSLIYLNGSTDYVELYGLISGSGSCAFITTSGTVNWFSGVLVRSA